MLNGTSRPNPLPFEEINRLSANDIPNGLGAFLGNYRRDSYPHVRNSAEAHCAMPGRESDGGLLRIESETWGLSGHVGWTSR